ncbi:MAG: bacteriohemerythrin [Oryzomonas sp.]|uniref:bacteriohemerythrin n=1 Tax=Oryzomonas sp. TaxID=2855186 RepID=UPI00283CAFE2|nr:bacteriohemerythrin [Oryzomonas sp.]MDR3581414.1 bacteriohemerythrin [Oryzomonas sp.]
MSFMTWQSTFELDIKEFDDHHKHLIGLMNGLHSNFTNGSGKEVLGAVVGELIDYASYHFLAEETWMNKHKYPGLSQHQDEHTAFKIKIVEFRNDFQNGKAELTIEVLIFLMRWLTEHILVSDAQFGNFARRLSINDH